MWFNDISSSSINSIRNIFSSLYSKNYRIYFIGQGISLIGTWMQNIAMSWMVYRLTGSVFLLGVIGFTNQIPSFILSPFTGVLTDRYNRLKIMRWAQVFFMLQAFVIAILVLFNLIAVWHIIALSVIFGIISAFDAPARQALVMDLIDNPRNIGNAIALNSALFNGARLLGPAIAGFAIVLVGEGVCFLINACSFLAVIIALTLINIPARVRAAEPTPIKKSLKEGVHYTFDTPPIRILIILVAVLSLAGLPYIVLLPAYAKEILHGDSDTLGYLMSAMGAGAFLAALYMASRKTVAGLPKIISITVFLMGLAIITASFVQELYFALPVFFFGGLFMILTLASVNTLLQTLAAENMRGRVMSFYAMALMGTTPIGNLIAGSVASGMGIPHTLQIFGLITLGAGALFLINFKKWNAYMLPVIQKNGYLS